MSGRVCLIFTAFYYYQRCDWFKETNLNTFYYIYILNKTFLSIDEYYDRTRVRLGYLTWLRLGQGNIPNINMNLLASNASFQSNKQAMFYACLFFNFSYCCVLLFFIDFYVNELFASLKTCVSLSNEQVLNKNTIVYGLMVEYALHKI